MPYDLRIDPTNRRVHVRAYGPSTFEEARGSADALIADPLFDPTYAILVDGRELEYLASYEDALQFRDMFDRMKLSFRGPIAVVVQGTARYGVSRMIASLADLVGVRMEAFLALPDAEEWRPVPGLMSFSYERRHQPLATMVQFRRRVVHHATLALGGMLFSVLVGTVGYHLFGRQAWLDSFVNACMLLGGMGQVGDVTTNAGKWFAALFALYAGLMFIAISGLLLAPFLHRLMHVFHLEGKS